MWPHNKLFWKLICLETKNKLFKALLIMEAFNNHPLNWFGHSWVLSALTNVFISWTVSVSDHKEDALNFYLLTTFHDKSFQTISLLIWQELNTTSARLKSFLIGSDNVGFHFIMGSRHSNWTKTPFRSINSISDLLFFTIIKQILFFRKTRHYWQKRKGFILRLKAKTI